MSLTKNDIPRIFGLDLAVAPAKDEPVTVYNFETVVIEATRRCNMLCKHCLRGNARNVDLNLAYAEKFFSMPGLGMIDRFCITGGETALVPHIIEGIAALIVKYDVKIRSYYIATNGLIASAEFIKAIKSLTMAMQRPYDCQLDISNDKYHECCDVQSQVIGNKRILYDALGDIQVRIREDYYRFSLVGEGRAKTKNLSINPVDCFIVGVNAKGYVDGVVYLGANGWIVDGCDWSYYNQMYHRLFHIDDISSFIGAFPAVMSGWKRADRTVRGNDPKGPVKKRGKIVTGVHPHDVVDGSPVAESISHTAMLRRLNETMTDPGPAIAKLDGVPDFYPGFEPGVRVKFERPERFPITRQRQVGTIVEEMLLPCT